MNYLKCHIFIIIIIIYCRRINKTLQVEKVPRPWIRKHEQENSRRCSGVARAYTALDGPTVYIPFSAPNLKMLLTPEKEKNVLHGANPVPSSPTVLYAHIPSYDTV